MTSIPFPQDRALAARVQAGEAPARREFLERFLPDLLRTAHRWCRRVCPQACSWDPGKFLSWERRDQWTLQYCDELFEAYVFLGEKLLDKLKFYQGDCSLSVWIGQTLVPIPAKVKESGRYGERALYADYLATRYGRKTLPRVLISEPVKVQQIFHRLRRGWTEEEIAARTGQTVEDVQAGVKRLEARLREVGWSAYWYWLGHLSVEMVPLFSTAEGGTEIERDPVSLDPDPETWLLAHASYRALKGSLEDLLREERICLYRKYARGWTAGRIGEWLVPPRDATQVEELLRRALQKIVGHLHMALTPYGEVRVNVPRLRAILAEWGTEVFNHT